MAQDQGLSGTRAPTGADAQALGLVTLLAQVYLSARAGVEDATGETQELGVQLREVATVVERGRFQCWIVGDSQGRGRVQLLGGSIGRVGQHDAVALHDAILEQGTGDVVQGVALDAEFKRDFRSLEAAAKGVGLSSALAEPRWFCRLALRLGVVLVEGGLVTGELAFFNTGWNSDVLLRQGHFG